MGSGNGWWRDGWGGGLLVESGGNGTEEKVMEWKKKIHT